MRIVACSAVDPASENIRTALLQLAPWAEVGTFDGSPARRREDAVLVTLRDEHLYRDHLDGEVREALGVEVDAVVYASRHRSAAGRRALTAHPIGNFATADYGGRAGTLVPAAPHLLGSALRGLRAAAAGLPFEVTLECTHHGPALEAPALYMEVGSDESGWRDADAAHAVARAILGLREEPLGVAVGFGGGHYVPRMSDAVAKGLFDPGHMAAAWAIEAAGAKVVDLAVAATPGATHAIFQTRSAEREAHRELRSRVVARGLHVVDDVWLDQSL